MKVLSNSDKQELVQHRQLLSDQAHEAYQFALMSGRASDVREAVLRAWIVGLNHSSKNDARAMRFGQFAEIAEFAAQFLQDASTHRDADEQLYKVLEPELRKGAGSMFWKFNGVAEHPLDQQLVELGLEILPEHGGRFNLLRKVGWCTLTLLVTDRATTGLEKLTDLVQRYGGSALVFNHTIVQALQVASRPDESTLKQVCAPVRELVGALTEE